ncbi:MAG TPA: homoserine dehydrogenase [Solirubrobacteraceae bacterium]|jgi:homoserine dehydrogenase
MSAEASQAAEAPRAVEAPQALAAQAPGVTPLTVGLLGRGTVGSAFEQLLAQRASAIAEMTGRLPAVGGVLTRSSGSFEEILSSSDVIVELIGGLEPARTYALEAMRAGKHLVTANKQLLCEHGEELFEAAQEHRVNLRFEAAVAGVVPVIRVLSESLPGIEVQRIHGIVNGTTNFILSEMERGASYEQALAEAQARGFAEADPSEDVTGRDAAAKMAILARLAFGTPVRLSDVRYEGIEQLSLDDIQYARELGLGLKLIGAAERLDDGLSVWVHPAFLYAGHPLASVTGSYNAVTVEAESITEITMSGPGAGGLQTASAVLGDLISAISQRPTTLCPVLPPTPLPLLQDTASAFYLHIEVADRPGVLVAIATVLDHSQASIKSVLQRGLGENARLVMVTHPIAESRLRAAVAEIAELEFVRSPPRAIRVIEEEFT